MFCAECDPELGGELWHCHEPSVEHADGTTECLADEPCDLPHHLHHLIVRCADLDPPCYCDRFVEVEPGRRHPVADHLDVAA